MKKSISFLKKPLLIVSSILFVVSLVSLIVVSSVSHGKVYKSDELEDYGQYLTITFEDDDTLEIENEVWGETLEEEYQYKVEDKKLYIKYSPAGDYEYAGRINSFELLLKYGNSASPIQLEFECGVNEVIKDVSVAFVAVSIVLIAVSVVVIVLDKNGKLNFLTKEKSTEVESQEKTENE